MNAIDTNAVTRTIYCCGCLKDVPARLTDGRKAVDGANRCPELPPAQTSEMRYNDAELAQIKADIYGCIAHGEICFIDPVAFLKKLLPYLRSPEPVAVDLEAGATTLWRTEGHKTRITQRTVEGWKDQSEETKDKFRDLAQANAQAWGLSWK